MAPDGKDISSLLSARLNPVLCFLFGDVYRQASDAAVNNTSSGYTIIHILDIQTNDGAFDETLIGIRSRHKPVL